MRQIKFRGKSIETGQWVYGSLLQMQSGSSILVEDIDAKLYDEYKVIPDTVGQFTGLYDKDGREIYEGDILRFPTKDKWEEKNFVSFEVFFHDNDCCERHIGWQMNRIHFQGNICGTGRDPQFKPSTTAQMVVIGNIHDNPELLKMK